LRGLQVVRAGFLERAAAALPQWLPGAKALALLHCVNGSGWCEVSGRLRSVRTGDVLVLPPEVACSLGSNRTSPWSMQCLEASGDLVPDYLEALAPTAQPSIIHAGDALQIARLFGETLNAFHQGSAFAQRLHASHALAYLLALLIRELVEAPRETGDAVNKIAETILYMSDHLEEPLRVSALARMAGLSQAYFGQLFKAQAGCSPREYLHLLRIHRARQLLQKTNLTIKEIAARIGYQDPFHFSRQFKAFQGASPSDYRRGPSIPSC